MSDQSLTPHALPDDATGEDLLDAWRTGPVFGPPIRKIFRDVIADRLPEGCQIPQAAMLFAPTADPFWESDFWFLGDFYSVILHQDTCRPSTAEGIRLIAALAVDDRVPARYRFGAVNLLFSAATVAERHLASCWPDTPMHADTESEAQTRSVVATSTPTLLARWDAECPAVRLALAGLAVVFPTDRTLPALASRLRTFADQHPLGTDIGDYVHFVLLLAAQNDDETLAAVEKVTDAYWRGTSRGAPTRARALHLLGQMLDKIGSTLTRSRPGE
ncbi:hypothetical protein [Streptomyces fagopyri]|uniref:hypothetical protein n=1 Tax=Streptomyces fagopyri TaxID=2662397 RepID=UPI0037FD17AB